MTDIYITLAVEDALSELFNYFILHNLIKGKDFLSGSMIRATRIILILTDFVDRQVRMTAIRAADGPAKSTGKEDKKRKAHFPFLILFPCTFGNITDQQNPLASEILQFFSNT